MVKALINKHVDPNSKCLSVLLHCWWWSSTEPVNNAGDTPLSLACANGHLDTVKYLVNQHHCDPKSKHWYIIMVHQLLHHSVHSYMYRYSQQGWWHPILSGLHRWTLGSGKVSRHHSSLWYNKHIIIIFKKNLTVWKKMFIPFFSLKIFKKKGKIF